jgi:hypothetical protein
MPRLSFLDRLPIEAPAHFLTGLEERRGFLIDRYMRACSRIAADASGTVLDRKHSKAAQLYPISSAQSRLDLTHDCIDDVCGVALVKVSILGSNALDKV